MNQSFLDGFDKQASLAGTVGRMVGKSRTLPTQAKNLATAAKKLPGQAVDAAKKFRANSARQFQLNQSRAMGRTLREEAGRSTKGMKVDVSKNVKDSKAFAKQEMKKYKQREAIRQRANPGATPGQAPAPYVKKEKPTSIGQKARNLATVGVLAGTAGAYQGLKDQPQQ